MLKALLSLVYRWQIPLAQLDREPQFHSGCCQHHALCRLYRVEARCYQSCAHGIRGLRRSGTENQRDLSGVQRRP
ncbi:uncharacterized protein CC84DRAFT_160348 [Paraphaeosphaeria sporulosa]|uniref:Uncharacterized protein n=1 Tax=Paraphaeosphaeria sporulosa TaxID=1460663 RepID=A0A177D054_9PLEO|nr:uncharacterized protein CC84DRAFT_160348 [Paraphaeosphaeria sporulosa]OAG12801.1 hypothetical protein CC84DRAFT_160348 [Paraphaeosphaeria sporulosa]